MLPTAYPADHEMLGASERCNSSRVLATQVEFDITIGRQRALVGAGPTITPADEG